MERVTRSSPCPLSDCPARMARWRWPVRHWPGWMGRSANRPITSAITSCPSCSEAILSRSGMRARMPPRSRARTTADHVRPRSCWSRTAGSSWLGAAEVSRHWAERYAAPMLNRRLTTLVAAGVAVLLPLAVALGADPVQPGPPFPEPVFDQAVYDGAGVFRPSTIATLETTIDAIEARTGAGGVGYTQ